MIKHPDMTPQLLLDQFRQPELHSRRLDGQETPEERAAMQMKMRELLEHPREGFKIICIGCGDTDVSLLDSVACVCGGFVCPACIQIEGEGECHHEKPTPPDGWSG